MTLSVPSAMRTPTTLCGTRVRRGNNDPPNCYQHRDCGCPSYVGGTRLGFKGMHDGTNPLLIAHGAALTTVFIIVLLLTRLVAAGVGTVALSLGASFGPSMLVWQHPIATPESSGPWGGSKSVVTVAGLVFAFTMMPMAVREMTVVAQIGNTTGLASPTPRSFARQAPSTLDLGMPSSARYLVPERRRCGTLRLLVLAPWTFRWDLGVGAWPPRRRRRSRRRRRLGR
jgi:hypothetical protein